MINHIIAWADGSFRLCGSYEEACDIVTARYPGAEIGHDGDLDDGGERTLCWETADDANNDDGADAIATIRVRA